jgi:dTDP-4-amino-4,6-dideoxygalactose transaminase
VLVPGVTFLASANAVRQVGAQVTFVDVDPSTGLVTPELLDQAIQGYKGPEPLHTFINVHYAGQCEDLEAIAAVARGHGLYIVEDAAHAIGSVYVDRQGRQHPIGSCAYCDLTTFSFHPLKTIATGEGGAVTTANPDWAHTVATLRTHGMLRSPQHWVHPDEGLEKDPSSPDPLPHPWYYEMQELGYNFRLSDMACALGNSQLAQLAAFKAERQRLVALYDAALPALGLPSLRRLRTCDPAWHLYVIRPDWSQLKRTRSQQMRHLHALGIGSQVHYMPLYRHPYYVQCYGVQAAQFEGCETLASRALSLPLYVGLGQEGVQRVLEALQGL